MKSKKEPTTQGKPDYLNFKNLFIRSMLVKQGEKYIQSCWDVLFHEFSVSAHLVKLA